MAYVKGELALKAVQKRKNERKRREEAHQRHGKNKKKMKGRGHLEGKPGIVDDGVLAAAGEGDGWCLERKKGSS